MAANKLTVKQEHFAQLVSQGISQTEAYVRSYDTRPGRDRQSIGIAACALAAHPGVSARIAELKAAAVQVAVMDAADVVRHLVEIAIADPNELTQHRRVNCRHCNGIDHGYQWKNRGEFVQAMDRWTEARDEFEKRNTNKRYKKPPPIDDGGYGFRANGEIHSECPACEGEGIDELFIADTRKLTGPAKRLYAGAKRTKNGIEIMTRSQDNALKLLGERYGLFKTVVESNNINTTTLKIDYSKLSKETIKELLKAQRDAAAGS